MDSDRKDFLAPTHKYTHLEISVKTANMEMTKTCDIE